MFLEEVTCFPSKRETNFTIELMLGVTLVSNVAYHIITPKLVELKI